MSELLVNFEHFVIDEILRNEISDFTQFQLAGTGSPDLTHALAKISIEVELAPFNDDLIKRLDAEQDEITLTELMVKIS